MKFTSLILLSSLIVFSGINACSESGVTNNNDNPSGFGGNNPNPNPNTTQGETQPVPDDLEGTNLAPPPAP